MVGHAHRIDASDYAADGLRYGQKLFLHDLEVPDDVDAGIGSDERYLVQLVIPEESFRNLDDALAAHGLAVQIDPECDRMLGLIERSEEQK